MSSAVPSGEQFEIAHGEQRATIVEVGGGIRRYSSAGREVLDPYPFEAICDGAHGTPLIPWPNRLADGAYSFDGANFQLALSEPARHNASHGLLRWRAWRALQRAPDRVVMGIDLHPTPGYPFALEVLIDYSLSDAGLTVATTARNVGQAACPFGAGQHPYLSAGGALLDECELQLAAATAITVDEERKLPIGRQPVAGSAADFNNTRLIGTQSVDLAFTDLERDAEGLAWVRLAAPDRRCAELWLDQSYRFLQIYSGDTLAPERRRRGLAAEPMSCASNAFQSGDGLLRLEPGESFTARWGVRLR
jgi:aldose 1-epimerase